MNPSTALARVVVDELVRQGIADVVLAPGSRSAPLALTLADAERQGRVRLHVRVDERSAGYLAVGLARGGRSPVAVVTTSGTAAVNLHPAVVEAGEAGVPLLALTADRPPELRQTGANQTIDQVRLFGPAVRWFCELGVARREPGQVAYWRAVLARAVATAADPVDPGPVHLNLAFADPLTPGPGPAWPQPLAGRPDGRGWTVDGRLSGALAVPLDVAVRTAVAGWRVPARGVIVLGDHADDEVPDLVADLADALGWPVLAEPTGAGAGLPGRVPHASLLLADPAFAAAYAPACVLTVGRVGLSRAVLQLIRAAAFHVAVDPRPAPRWADPTRTADVVLAAVPLPPERPPADDPDWSTGWSLAGRRAAAVLASELADTAAEGLSGLHVARAVAARPEPGDLLVVGPSWAPRHLEAVADDPTAGVEVIANRGTSGIDGVVSTAWGAALAHRSVLGGGVTYALLGDLAFLYDHNGLLAPVVEPRPDLVLVVVDNDGGGIFSALEQGAPRFAADFERVFGTPHGLDLAAVAATAGLPAGEVTDLTGLAAALAAATDRGGTSVVVARTRPRAAEAALLRRLQRAVSSAWRVGSGAAPT